MHGDSVRVNRQLGTWEILFIYTEKNFTVRVIKYWHTLLRETELSILGHIQNLTRSSAAWSCWICFEQEFGLDKPWRSPPN